MSKLMYDFRIIETICDKNSNIYDVKTELPHQSEIIALVKKTWDLSKSGILQSFPDEIQKAIQNIDIRFKNDKEHCLIATIIVNPISGYRWSAKKRKCVFDTLDGQISDGFGECIAHKTVHSDDKQICLIDIA